MATSVQRLSLTNFRNYSAEMLDLGGGPIVLVGPNGAGKTNLLEAVSLLAPGQGLRRASYSDLARAGTGGDWAVSARVATPSAGVVEIGTGLMAGSSRAANERGGRIVRIDRQTVSGSGALADLVRMVWLIPAMDGLFTGPAGERRRFLDRLILCFDPAYRTRLAHFERALRQRNRLLEQGERAGAHLDGLEREAAETGVAIAAARAEAVARLAEAIAQRRVAAVASSFPWAELSIEGSLEAELAARPALEVEDGYRRTLRDMRERDRAVGRTLEGPHRSDLVVGYGPKSMPARLCSTGEQKALLIGLVLAHAELLAADRSAGAPILLLDEISAHLDEGRRAALYAEILRLDMQAWMTGTDRHAFAGLEGAGQLFEVADGAIRRLAAAA